MSIQPIDYEYVKEQLLNVKTFIDVEISQEKKKFSENGFIDYKDVCTIMSTIQVLNCIIDSIDKNVNQLNICITNEKEENLKNE